MPQQYSSKTQAYADGLRGYSANPFSGQATQSVTSMAPHLSQAPSLDANLLQAYRNVRADPRAAAGGQDIPDIDKLWRMSPTSSVFKPGYAHNMYVTREAGVLGNIPKYGAPIARQAAEYGISPEQMLAQIGESRWAGAGMSPEQIAAYKQQQTQSQYTPAVIQAAQNMGMSPEQFVTFMKTQNPESSGGG